MSARLAAAAALLGALALPGVAPAQQPAPPAVRYDQHVNVAGNPPPGDSLRNPFAGDRRVAEEGARLFGGFNCAGCHAGGAVGSMGPSLADGRWRYGGSDGAVFHSIFYGRPRGMPAFGGHLPAATIWRLVTYLRSLEPARDTLSTTAWSP
jgi:cytochrome c oxidase cbb3-type subunit 3